MKITNKRELQQIAFNHSSDIVFDDFKKSAKESNKEVISFQLILITFHQIIF